MVYIRLITCRHLNAADLDTSDPYPLLSLAMVPPQSTVKSGTNLNPVYYETFQIDVTNSGAKLNCSLRL